jgi:hypothetical protein
MALTVADLLARLRFDTREFTNGAAKVQSQAQSMEKSFASAGTASLKMIGAITGIATVGAGFALAARSVLDMNRTLERAQLGFEVLLGSADAAKAHVRDLFQFAKKTPFETGPILAASRTLQTFGVSASDVMGKLNLVGDAAAITGTSINEIALWFGRAYSALQSGAPFGEAAMRLQELGILTPQARTKLEALAASGADTATKIAALDEIFGRFGGSMVKMAGTWEGLTSTIKDSVGLLLADAFKPLFEDVKGGMASMVQSLENIDVTALTQQLQPAFDIVKNTVTSFGNAFVDLLPTLRAAGKGLAAFFLALSTGVQVVLIPFRGLIAGLSALVEGDFSGAWDKAKDAMADQAKTAADSATKLGALAMQAAKVSPAMTEVATSTTKATAATKGITGAIDDARGAFSSFLSLSDRLRDHYSNALPFAFGKTIDIIDKTGNAGERMGDELVLSFNEGRQSADQLNATVQRLHGSFARVEEIRAASNEAKKLAAEQKASAETAQESQREAARGFSLMAREAAVASGDFTTSFNASWEAFKKGFTTSANTGFELLASMESMGKATAGALSSGISNFAASAITDFDDVGKAAKQFGLTMVKVFTDILAAAAVKQVLSLLSGVLGGGSILSAVFKSGTLHQGGVAGVTGGLNIGPSEVLALLEKGETVLSKDFWTSAPGKMGDIVSGGVSGITDWISANPGLTAGGAAALVGLALQFTGNEDAAKAGQALGALAPLIGAGTTIATTAAATGSLSGGLAAMAAGTAATGLTTAAATGGALALPMIPIILGSLISSNTPSDDLHTRAAMSAGHLAGIFPTIQDALTARSLADFSALLGVGPDDVAAAMASAAAFNTATADKYGVPAWARDRWGPAFATVPGWDPHAPGSSVYEYARANLPSFHEGGIAGETGPALVERGEGVFTEEQMAAMGGGGTLVVKVMIGEHEIGEAVIRDFQRRALGGDRDAIPAEMIHTRNRS